MEHHKTLRTSIQSEFCAVFYSWGGLTLPETKSQNSCILKKNNSSTSGGIHTVGLLTTQITPEQTHMLNTNPLFLSKPGRESSGWIWSSQSSNSCHIREESLLYKDRLQLIHFTGHETMSQCYFLCWRISSLSDRRTCIRGWEHHIQLRMFMVRVTWS